MTNLSRLFFICLLLVSIVSCHDPEDAQPQDNNPQSNNPQGNNPQDDNALEVTGIILDEKTGQPIEGVSITGFIGGTYTDNIGTSYGTPTKLGTSDKCGKYKILLNDSISGTGAHGFVSNDVPLKFDRADYGVKEVSVSLKKQVVPITMNYEPVFEKYLEELYFVQAKDGKSVTIGWKVHSLFRPSIVESGHGNYVLNQVSDGMIGIMRQGENTYYVALKVAEDQTVTETDLPSGDFKYTFVMDEKGGHFISFDGDLVRNSFDTVFVVKPLPKHPVLNHCN